MCGKRSLIHSQKLSHPALMTFPLLFSRYTTEHNVLIHTIHLFHHLRQCLVCIFSNLRVFLCMFMVLFSSGFNCAFMARFYCLFSSVNTDHFTSSCYGHAKHEKHLTARGSIVVMTSEERRANIHSLINTIISRN